MKRFSSSKNMHGMIFGTYKLLGPDLVKALDFGYSLGYRHIDTASLYKNESDIGTWIVKSGVNRESLFITTKVWPTDYRSIESACDRSLHNLKTDYIDSLLLHWPVALKTMDFQKDFSHIDRTPLNQVWSQMEVLKSKGKVKNIGVSNWNVSLLNDLLSYSTIPPALNQIEMQVYNQRKKLVSFCSANGISVSAYRLIFRTPEHEAGYRLKDSGADNEVVRMLSEKYRVTPNQILIKWALQRGCSVIIKSSTSAHIEENWNSQFFNISDTDMEAINQIPYRGIYTNTEKSVGLHIEN